MGEYYIIYNESWLDSHWTNKFGLVKVVGKLYHVMLVYLYLCVNDYIRDYDNLNDIYKYVWVMSKQFVDKNISEIFEYIKDNDFRGLGLYIEEIRADDRPEYFDTIYIMVTEFTRLESDYEESVEMKLTVMDGTYKVNLGPSGTTREVDEIVIMFEYIPEDNFMKINTLGDIANLEIGRISLIPKTISRYFDKDEYMFYDLRGSDLDKLSLYRFKDLCRYYSFKHMVEDLAPYTGPVEVY